VGYGNATIAQEFLHVAVAQVKQEESQTPWLTISVGNQAVAQNLPCEKNRVIMGQEFPLKLSQREQDARQEAPMRTPKR
jgi:hypothetical protein